MASETSVPGLPTSPAAADRQQHPDRRPDPTAPPQAQLGDYDLLKPVGEGGMGTVYKARHRPTGEIVAVKVIASGPARNPIVLQRFEREFQAAKVLEHPNVVRAIRYHGTHTPPYLVMEFVDGESLGQRMERAGAVPEAEAIRIIGQMCDGLQRAHKQGLVHRDVKPDNIMVTRDGVAKLTDMGLVKDVDNDMNLTKTGRGLGTPHYMAPEQFRNAKGVDARGDIYALAATLYALVTGVVPFSNSSPLDCWLKKVRNEFPPPRELNPVVSERVDWAIRRAMSAEPSLRPASCREFYEDLTGQSRPPSGVMARPGPNGSAADLWYMVYRDETGQAHTVKGTTEAIRDALRNGLLGDGSTILVGRSKVGQFQQVHSVPEFRDLVLGPAPLADPYRGGRLSGSVPPAGDRPIPQSGVIDLGSLPQVLSGVEDMPTPRPNGAGSGRVGVPAPLSGPSSGHLQAAGTPPSGVVRSKRPTPGRVVTPTPVPDPTAETLAGDPKTPLPMPVRRSPGPGDAGGGKKPFDWMPVLAAALLVASAVLGFLYFNR
jgi:serine/threonine protein kinase